MARELLIFTLSTFVCSEYTERLAVSCRSRRLGFCVSTVTVNWRPSCNRGVGFGAGAKHRGWFGTGVVLMPRAGHWSKHATATGSGQQPCGHHARQRLERRQRQQVGGRLQS